jgi:hypothetical protein
VAALAPAAGFGYVDLVAEDRFGGPFGPVCYVSRLTLVATDAVLLSGYAESLDTGMAGSAGFRLLHFGHGEMPGSLDIENSVVTDTAVIVILFQVDVMTEDYRIGILEFEKNVFGFLRQ